MLKSEGYSFKLLSSILHSSFKIHHFPLSCYNSDMSEPQKIIVAITGASGAPYAVRIVESLLAAGAEVLLIVSANGKRLLADELDIADIDPRTFGRACGKITTGILTILPYKDVGACVASGSFRHSGMIVVPCSNHTMAEMAHGLGDNLITRAAMVTLKERRKLIVVHREMPLGLIEIRNMQALAEAGAIMCPANPGFYTHPQSVDDIVNMVAGRVLDLLDVPHHLHKRWNGKTAE